MKRIIITLVLMLLLSSCATTGDYFSWDETNTKLHVPLTLLMVADLGQSTWTQEHYWGKYRGATNEQNKFIGKYPSKEEVREYFALSYLVTTGLTYILPPDWSHGFQTGVITMEVIVVEHNYSIGIGVKF